MSDIVHVRDATAADASTVAGVMCRALQAAYLSPEPVTSTDRDATDPEHRDAADARRRLATLTPDDLLAGARATLTGDDPTDRTLVAEVDGEAVGFHRLRVHDTSGRTGEVASLYVDPTAWQAGTGDRLLRAGLDQLHLDGCSTAFLWVAEENERAVRFYRRRGFVPDGATQRYRLTPWGVDLGVELTIVRFVCDLPPPELEAQGDASSRHDAGVHDAGVHDRPTQAAFGPVGSSDPSERDRT